MGNRSKQKGLTLKQQENLIQDLENMIAVNVAYKEYLESIGKFEECKEFTRNWLKKIQKEEEKIQ